MMRWLLAMQMTLAKLSVFIEADGIDKVDGVPLVRIEGTPEPNTMAVRNATGVADIRCRPMWREWSIKLRVRFDEDQFSVIDEILVQVTKQVTLAMKIRW